MLKNLTIAEEFVLLALDRETNKLKSLFRQHIALYTVMACMVELSLEGKLRFEDDDTVTIIDSAPTGDKSLDRLLSIMMASNRPKKVKKWASYFYNHMFKQHEIYKLAVERLVEKEILEVKNKEILFVIPKKKYVDVTNTRSHIVEKIRAELLEDGKVEEHTIALVLFLHSKKILNDYFSDFERKALKQRIEKLRKEKIFATIKSIDKAIQNMDAAIAVSTFTAT